MTMDVRRDIQKVTGPQECAGCGKKISERYLLKALDMYWHEDCLKCGCCDCRLGEVGSTLFTKANLILCKRDYLRLFGATGYCAACNKVIPAFEMVMRARSNVYHLECFACQQCNHRFCVGDRFYLWDNKILCEYDYEERLVFANIPYHGNPNGAGPPGQLPQQLQNDVKSPLPPGAGGGAIRNLPPMQQQQSPGGGVGYMHSGQHQVHHGMMPSHQHQINGIQNEAIIPQHNNVEHQQQQSLSNGHKMESTTGSSPGPGGDPGGKYYMTLTSNNNHVSPLHSDGVGGGGLPGQQQQAETLGRNSMICNGAFTHATATGNMSNCRIPSPQMGNSAGGNTQQPQKAK